MRASPHEPVKIAMVVYVWYNVYDMSTQTSRARDDGGTGCGWAE